MDDAAIKTHLDEMEAASIEDAHDADEWDLEAPIWIEGYQTAIDDMRKRLLGA